MAVDPLIGKVLHDTHEIVRRIGIGGMGTVYEAVHVRLRKQRFAVKVLHAGMVGNASLYARFRQEAEVSSAIGHPNIVYVTDFYETDQGQPCIVMEYLRGMDLARRLKQKQRLTTPKIIRIVEQVGSALQAVHDEGVVHRDMKPGNIFLCDAKDGSTRVKVLDFGISKIRDSGASITGDMAVLGTPSYMSPEQGEGWVQEVDSRTDIFALGIICYRLLSNVLPFGGPTMVAVIRAICDKPHRPITAFRPDLGDRVDRVLNRALAKDKEQRYPRIDAFVQELKAALVDREPHGAGVEQIAPDEEGAAAAWETAGQVEEATTPIPMDLEPVIVPVPSGAQTVSSPGEKARPAFGPESKTVKEALAWGPTQDPKAETEELDRVEAPPAKAPEVEAALILQGVTGDTTLSGATGQMPASELPVAPAANRKRVLVAASACASVLALAGVVFLLWPPADNAVFEPAVVPVEELSGGAMEAPAAAPGPDAAMEEAPRLTPDAAVKVAPDSSLPDMKQRSALKKRQLVKKARPARKRPVARTEPKVRKKPAPDKPPAKVKRPAEQKKRPAFEDF